MRVKTSHSALEVLAPILLFTLSHCYIINKYFFTYNLLPVQRQVKFCRQVSIMVFMNTVATCIPSFSMLEWKNKSTSVFRECRPSPGKRETGAMPVLSRSCKQETRFKTVTGVFIFSGKANRCIACKPENLLTDYYHSSREMTAIVNNSEKDPAQAGLFCCAVSCQTVSVFITEAFLTAFFVLYFPWFQTGAHTPLCCAVSSDPKNGIRNSFYFRPQAIYVLSLRAYIPT